MTLKAVFLDAGRTLVTERTSRAAMYAAAGRRRGLEVEDEFMARCMSDARRQLPRVLNGAFRYSEAWFEAFIQSIFVGRLGLAEAELPELQAELLACFSDPGQFRLYQDSRELLVELARSRLFVGILSNWSERLEELFEGLGVADLVDGFVVSSLVRAEKPEPAIFQEALDLAGVPASEALHAGDEPELDYAGARSAGLRAILVDHADACRDFVGERVTSLADLRARILQEAT
ncbi:MAG: HAD-IA family hydrolase [Planctomycetes bacterium]|nr:HAD-IA family hydrolase [Planctomycetota bacterium]MCB9905182.1 HAD-IA family hydrolase [Planctomycetota bacterium]